MKEIAAHLRQARPNMTACEYLQELTDSDQEMIGWIYVIPRKGGGSKKGGVRLLPNAAKASMEKAISC